MKKAVTEKHKIPDLISVIITVLVAFLWYMSMGAGLFFYQENSMLFIFSPEYFQRFADKPGGLLSYLGNFLTQFYFSPAAGAALIAGLAALLSLELTMLARVFRIPQFLRPAFIVIPALFPVVLQNQFDFHLHDWLGILTVPGSFLLFTGRKSMAAWFPALVFFPILYFIAGSYSFIFSGMYAVNSLANEKIRTAILRSCSMLAVVFLTVIISWKLIFLQPLSRLLLYPLFVNESVLLKSWLTGYTGLLIFLPALASGASLMKAGRSLQGIFCYFVPFIAGVIAIVLLFISTDRGISEVMKFEKMAFAGDMTGIIREQEKVRSANIVVQFYYNLALSETGQLCNRMFYGPQNFGPAALTMVRNDDQSDRAMYFYYIIGLTGEAHHLAFEQMVQHGYRPDNLLMLIRTELIHGNYRVAQRYVGVLKKTLHYRQQALAYEKMLGRPDLVSSDPDLGKRQGLLPGRDFYVVADDFRNVEMLLESNPGNKMAFEYKLARLMLDKDIIETGNQVGKMKSLGYERLPRHIEEAVVSYASAKGSFPEMTGLTISSETDQRFMNYASALRSFRNDRKSAEMAVRKEDRNTFWYYLQFGLVKRENLKRGQTDPAIY